MNTPTRHREIAQLYEDIQRRLFDAASKASCDIAGIPIFPGSICRDTLFHYTDINGLLGIIESEKIWMHNSRFMNDASERTHARDVINSALKTIISTHSYEEKFINVLAHALNKIADNKYEHYIACFTCDEDSLPLWSFYTQCTGVAIEFDLTKNFPFIEWPRCFFYKMIYNDASLISILSNLVENSYDLYKEYSTHPESRIAHEIIKDAIEVMSFQFINNFKNENFKHENEIRLLYTLRNSDRTPKFRIKNGVITSYIPHPHHELNKQIKLPIKSVTIGPHPSINTAHDSIRMLLNAFGFSDVEIKFSKIPYRAI